MSLQWGSGGGDRLPGGPGGGGDRLLEGSGGEWSAQEPCTGIELSCMGET